MTAVALGGCHSAFCVATIERRRVREERQNFDPASHYARPAVTQLTVDRRRQGTLSQCD